MDQQQDNAFNNYKFCEICRRLCPRHMRIPFVLIVKKKNFSAKSRITSVRMMSLNMM